MSYGRPRSAPPPQIRSDPNKLTRLNDQVRDGYIDTRRAGALLWDTTSPQQQMQRYRDEYDSRYSAEPAEYEPYDDEEYDRRYQGRQTRRGRYAQLTPREQQFNEHDLVRLARAMSKDDRAEFGPFAICCTPVKGCFSGLFKLVLMFVGAMVFLVVSGWFLKAAIFIWPYLWWTPFSS